MRPKSRTGEEAENPGGVLLTLKEDRCVGCTHCIRVCPTEAIRVRGGKARRTPYRCIDCGECLRVCPWKAWTVKTDPSDPVGEKSDAVAVLDPAVFGQFGNRAFPRSILQGFEEIGFSQAREMREGLFLYCRAVGRYLSSGRSAPPAISSDCPAVVQLVQVKFPSLLENLIPVASPFEIMARRLRKKFQGPREPELWYIVPCLAKARAATEARIPDGAYHRAVPILDYTTPCRPGSMDKKKRPSRSPGRSPRCRTSSGRFPGARAGRWVWGPPPSSWME